jgi:BASS family bile acid:Na+ symporter
MTSYLNRLFPMWALLAAVIAFSNADLFVRLENLIVPLLATVMFMMGLTLERADFQRVIADPRPVLVGVACQFVIMPLLALTLATMLQLSTQLTAGMVLVGSCAGGTASNVITYLARGDVALSISMTLSSTLVGVVATPLLCSFYLSQTVAVDTLGLLFSILQLVLLPVLLGYALNSWWPAPVSRLQPILPGAAIISILVIIATVVALNAERLLDVGLVTVVAVMLHNCLGLSGGYWMGRLLGFNLRQSQTLAIEVGMQNSGLGVALALQFFSATAALPGAIFSVWHNISGSILASYWSKKRESLGYLMHEAMTDPTLSDSDHTNPDQKV